MKDYEDKYGSPTLAANRKLGHKKAVVAGIKGVIVPGKREGPWKLKRQQGVNISKNEEHDVGSSE
eukprot:12410259-Karenia_brevis.AAC.1